MLYDRKFHYTVFIFVLLFSGVIGFLFGYRPLLQQIDELKLKESDLQNQVDKKLEMQRRVDRLNTDQLKTMEQIASVILTRIPDSDQMAQFMAKVSELAEQHNATEIHFSIETKTKLLAIEIPGDTGNAESYNCYKLPLTCEMTIEFQDLANFINDLDQMERIITIESLNIERETQASMTVSMKLSIFSLQSLRTS